jgi:hypothetical protein
MSSRTLPRLCSSSARRKANSDDETAFKVVDGTVEVISEGHWKLLTP